MLSRPRYIAAAGGAPILIGGEVAGGVGVSGDRQPPPPSVPEPGTAEASAAASANRAGRSSVLKPALLLTSGRTLAFGASFFIPVVLARVFSTAEFGTYKQLFLLIMTLYFTVQLGIANSLYYFVPREPERAGRFVANALAVLAAAGTLCAAVLIVERDALHAGFPGNSAIHRPRVDMAVPELLRHGPSDRALTGARRSVNRDDQAFGHGGNSDNSGARVRSHDRTVSVLSIRSV